MFKVWTYFTPCSSVSVVNFDHVITGWEVCQAFPPWNHCFLKAFFCVCEDYIFGLYEVF